MAEQEVSNSSLDQEIFDNEGTGELNLEVEDVKVSDTQAEETSIAEISPPTTKAKSDNPFGDLKKKKKKTDVQQSEFGEKKRKPKKTSFSEFEAQLDVEASTTVKEDWIDSNRDYTYTELLTRVFTILRQNNPEFSGEKSSYKIVPPQILREGTKKTAFANVIDIAKRMKRQPDHVVQFLFAELGTTGAIDGNQRLIIKGRFQQKQIETVLKRYIMEYVSCKTCKSAETILTKENRLFFVQCESCGSARSVSAIKTGFVAQTGKRVKPTD